MNNYTIKQQKSKDQEIIQLVYSGELSYNHIESIYSETETIIKTNAHYEILIEEADLLDLSFIQMLISLKKMHQPKITLNLSEDLTDLMQISGFYKYLIEEK